MQTKTDSRHSKQSGTYSDVQSTQQFALLFALLFLITQLPLYAVRYPDIADFPNHAARLHILLNIEALPALQLFYQKEFGIAPNMALDVLGVFLASILGIEHGLKVFVSISTLTLSTGALLFAVALTGKRSPLALGGLLFANNVLTQHGLFNFMLGVGLALWLLAAWIYVRQRRSLTARWLITFSAGTTLLYLCHLSAVGTFLLCVAGFECASVHRNNVRRYLKDGAAIALMLVGPVLMLHAFIYQPGISNSVVFPNSSFITLLEHKLRLFANSPGFLFFSIRSLDFAIAGALCYLIYIGVRNQAITIGRHGLFLVGALGCAFALLPPSGLGGTLVDARIMLPLALIAWGSLQLTDMDRLPYLDQILWISVGLSVFLTSAVTTWRFLEHEPMSRDLRRAMSVMEKGSKVATVDLDGGQTGLGLSAHSAAWSVIDRSTFLSSMFIRPFQPFAVGYRPQWVSIANSARMDGGSPPSFASLRSRFDYIVVFGTEAATSEYVAGEVPLYRNARSALLKIR